MIADQIHGVASGRAGRHFHLETARDLGRPRQSNWRQNQDRGQDQGQLHSEPTTARARSPHHQVPPGAGPTVSGDAQVYAQRLSRAKYPSRSPRKLPTVVCHNNVRGRLRPKPRPWATRRANARGRGAGRSPVSMHPPARGHRAT
ncbi:MAG: hypothetical protein OZSIB_1710 [Candidatus Ozemobacter sibiricus]|uniref:Uncharacterized protein n=1 Tax=Candidatus Ozemobacter sibiricus TaxID=2268124 RepID=A0A367ZJ83_9BACT|nr:MAG: hypothetical protein OZSIB_1710 [Candidatus Ozemobacter sibiricus]